MHQATGGSLYERIGAEQALPCKAKDFGKEAARNEKQKIPHSFYRRGIMRGARQRSNWCRWPDSNRHGIATNGF